MPSIPWQRVLQVLAIVFVLVSIVMSIAWYIYDPGFDPVLALLGGVIGILMGIGSFFTPGGIPQPLSISTTTTSNVTINGNSNIQQVTQSGPNINAPNSKIVAGRDVIIQQTKSSKEHERSTEKRMANLTVRSEIRSNGVGLNRYLMIKNEGPSHASDVRFIICNHAPYTAHQTSMVSTIIGSGDAGNISKGSSFEEVLKFDPTESGIIDVEVYWKDDSIEDPNEDRMLISTLSVSRIIDDVFI